VQPALALPDDMQPGSFLVFPLFDIRSGGGTRNQTRIRITNNGAITTDIHLTAICPGRTVANDGILDRHCRATDRKITLTSHQTAVLDVGTPFVSTAAPNSNPVYEFGLPVPCSEGYIVAYAQTAPTPGLPPPFGTGGQINALSYNSLYGDYQIIYNPGAPGAGPTSTVEAAPAIAIQSVQTMFNVLGVQNGGLLDLSFGTPVGVTTPDYTALPTYLLGDFAAIGGNLSPGLGGFSEIDTRLIVFILDVFADGNNPSATVRGTVWDAKENPFSISREFICWTRFSGSDSSFGGIFTKQPAGALDADYGSFRLSLTDGGGNLVTYNPAGLGAIEEVSSLGGTQGNTIRNMQHTVGNKSTVLTIDTANPAP